MTYLSSAERSYPSETRLYIRVGRSRRLFSGFSAGFLRQLDPAPEDKPSWADTDMGRIRADTLRAVRQLGSERLQEAGRTGCNFDHIEPAAVSYSAGTVVAESLFRNAGRKRQRHHSGRYSAGNFSYSTFILRLRLGAGDGFFGNMAVFSAAALVSGIISRGVGMNRFRFNRFGIRV